MSCVSDVLNRELRSLPEGLKVITFRGLSILRMLQLCFRMRNTAGLMCCSVLRRVAGVSRFASVNSRHASRGIAVGYMKRSKAGGARKGLPLLKWQPMSSVFDLHGGERGIGYLRRSGEV